MTSAERFSRAEASRLTRPGEDPTVGRRPMPNHRANPGRVTDFVSNALKPWRAVKVNDDGRKVVLSAHNTQEAAEAHAGAARDALTDADIGEGWNVVAERRQRAKR